MVVIVTVVPVVLLLTAVLVSLAGSKHLPRNRLAGIRTHATMKSDAAWTAAHRSAAPTVWIGAVTSTTAAVIALLSGQPAISLIGWALVLIFLATAVVALTRADRRARRVE
ncbi:SdpI family protein [Microbacterium sp. NPDC076768]|uniref:SdpI family protein n=1 Tax=Microbacterium sp. NPDC076768 TaxID=3154858 RepID=UPI003439405F